MKSQLRKLFWFILQYFEQDGGEYKYKPMHRKILIVVGVLFLALASGSIAASVYQGSFAYFVPILVFLAIGLVCTVVGFLGTDRAIARIWNNR